MPARVRVFRAPLIVAALGLVAPALVPAAHAQQAAPAVERPAAFDSAGRVLVVTPALAARLRLAPPAFPVAGPFVEARLFAAPDAGPAGPAVLSVSRAGGAVERYALGPPERAALAAAVASGLAVAGPGLRGDSAVTVSEPAGRAFVRNQTALGLLVYGPATAALVGANEAGVTIGYAAGAGAAFATSLAISRQRPVTRAQAILSGSAALGGAAATSGVLYLIGADEDRGYAGAVLAGAVGGSIAGFRRAAGMTDAEAAAATSAAFLGAGTVATLAGALGSYQGDEGRPTVAAGVAALGAGYALGPRYARTRRYTVTAGDVGTLSPAAVAGALLGGAIGKAVGGDDQSGDQAGWAGATLGVVGGVLAADRLLVRRADHTPSEADLLRLGTSVGGLLGLALANASTNDGTALMAAAGAGSVAGLAFSEAVLRPAADGGAARLRTSLRGTPLAPLAEPGRLRLSPGGLALARLTAARGGRGTFPVLSMTF
jgi:hypothetical protein